MDVSQKARRKGYRFEKNTHFSLMTIWTQKGLGGACKGCLCWHVAPQIDAARATRPSQELSPGDVFGASSPNFLASCLLCQTTHGIQQRICTSRFRWGGVLSCLSLVFLLARSVLHQCYLEKMKEVFWCFRGQVLKHLHNQEPFDPSSHPQYPETLQPSVTNSQSASTKCRFLNKKMQAVSLIQRSALLEQLSQVFKQTSYKVFTKFWIFTKI